MTQGCLPCNSMERCVRDHLTPWRTDEVLHAGWLTHLWYLLINNTWFALLNYQNLNTKIKQSAEEKKNKFCLPTLNNVISHSPLCRPSKLSRVHRGAHTGATRFRRYWLKNFIVINGILKLFMNASDRWLLPQILTICCQSLIC